MPPTSLNKGFLSTLLIPAYDLTRKITEWFNRRPTDSGFSCLDSNAFSFQTKGGQLFPLTPPFFSVLLGGMTKEIFGYEEGLGRKGIAYRERGSGRVMVVFVSSGAQTRAFFQPMSLVNNLNAERFYEGAGKTKKEALSNCISAAIAGGERVFSFEKAQEFSDWVSNT